MLVFAGTYTSHASKGIYAWRFRPQNARLTSIGVAAETGNPSFLVVNPGGKYVYAVNENGGASVMGSVSAFAVDARSGKLTALNWVSSKGGAPCHMALHADAKWLAVANCATGSVAILPVMMNGKLGEAVSIEQRVGAHARAVTFSPDGRFLLAAGMGSYRFDSSTGALTFMEAVPDAAGPIVFHPDGTTLYTVNEQTSTISAYRYDKATGSLQSIQSLPTAPEGSFGVNRPASILINAAGTVLYVSDPAFDVLAQFAIDAERHTLTPMEFPPVMGRGPAGIALDPTGAYLFSPNQKSGNITIFKVHPHTGQLQPAGPVGKNVPDVTCVVFVE